MNSPAPVPFELTAKQSAWFASRHRHITGLHAFAGNTKSVTAIVLNESAQPTWTKTWGTQQGDEDLGLLLFTELQTADPRWPKNKDVGAEAGYNLGYVIPPAAFPVAGYYWVEFTLTDNTASEGVTKRTFEGTARSTGTD